MLRSAATPLLLLAMLIAAVLPGLAAVPAGAQEAAPIDPEWTADAVEIAAGAPVVDFPNGIAFPVAISSDEPIAEIDLLYHAAFDETLTLSAADFDPGTAVDLTYELDLRDGALPAGLDLRWRWRVTEVDGDVAESPEQVLTWLDTRFSWQEVGDGLVTVHFYSGDEAFAREILAVAEETVARLSQRFGAEITEPLRIWVYGDRDDFLSAQAPNSEQWVAGAAYPWYGLIQAVLAPGDRAEVLRIIPHEVSHQVLHQATDNPFNGPPAWLDEGLATLEQGTGKEPMWMRLRAAAAEDRLPPLRTLNGQFPYDSEGALLAYAQSMAVVDYVIRTYGETGLSDLIAVFREGAAYDDALQQALGLTTDELDAAWRPGAVEQANRALAELGGDDGGAIGSVLSDGQAWLLASGSIVMGGAALAGLVVGWRAWRRSRDLEPDPEIEPAAEGGPNSDGWSRAAFPAGGEEPRGRLAPRTGSHP
jgi:hypothetical protein